MIETPLNVGLGLYIHQKTRSKELIDVLSDLNISINYDKALNIKASLASSVSDKMYSNLYFNK